MVTLDEPTLAVVGFNTRLAVPLPLSIKLAKFGTPLAVIVKVSLSTSLALMLTVLLLPACTLWLPMGLRTGALFCGG